VDEELGEPPGADARDQMRMRAVRREDVYERRTPIARRLAAATVGWLTSSSGEVKERRLDVTLRNPPVNTRMNVVAVGGPRGGTGKTTVTVSIGGLVSETSRLNIVAFDADLDYGPLPDCAPDASRSEKTVVDLLRDFEGDQPVALPKLRRYLSRMPSGLLVLAAPRGRREMSQLTAADLDRALSLLANFDVCLLDCAGGVQRDLAPWAIERADQLLIVTTAEYIGAQNVRRAMSELPLEKAILVINKVREAQSVNRDGGVLERRLFGELLQKRIVVRNDEQLHRMLDEARLEIRSLQRATRLQLKQLAVAVVEQLQ